MDLLTASDWVLLVLAAALVGLGKTALPGVVTLSVAIFAAVLPARESTAALLLLLLAGDLIAIKVYFRHADWAALKKLAPSVIAGIIAGAVFLGVVSDAVMRRSIGAILIVLTLLTIAFMKRSTAERLTHTFARREVRGFYGTLGGFTTMSANSGGPVMSLYFISSGFDVQRFLGTQAWFFFVVNLIKVPFSSSIGLITADVLTVSAILAPIVIVGALAGKRIANTMSLAIFTRIVLALTLASSIYLVIG